MSAVPPPPGSGPPVGSNLADKPVDSGGKPATSPSFSGNGTIGRLITAGVLSPPKSDQERLEVLQKQYAAHVTGSAPLQPRDSLAMRSEIDRLSSIVHPGQQSLWSDYSPAEKNYLAQQAAEKRRQANNIGMWFGGPVFAGLPAAARLLNAPETVVENLAGINANLAGVLPFGARSTGGRPVPRNPPVQQKQAPPTASPAPPGNGTVVSAKQASNFSDREKLVKHFEKHGTEFGSKNPDDYLQVGRDIMARGEKVEYFYKGEVRNGYASFMGNTSRGDAKFGFVGTNSEGFITTIHTQSGNSFWKMLNGSPVVKNIVPVP